MSATNTDVAAIDGKQQIGRPGFDNDLRGEGQ